MPVNYKAYGVDIDQYLAPYLEAPKNSNVNFKSGGNDLSNIFQKADNENFFTGIPIPLNVNGVPISDVFACHDTVHGVYETVNDSTSMDWANSIDANIDTILIPSHNTRFLDSGGQILFRLELVNPGSASGNDVAAALSTIKTIGVGKNFVNTYFSITHSPGGYFHYGSLTHDPTKGLSSLTSTETTLFTQTVGSTTVTLSGRTQSGYPYRFKIAITRSNGGTVIGDLTLKTFYKKISNSVPGYETGALQYSNIEVNNRLLVSLSYYILTYSGGAPTNDIFGRAVALSKNGNYLAVHRGTAPARLIVYRKTTTGWTQELDTTSDISGFDSDYTNISISNNGEWMLYTARTTVNEGGDIVYFYSLRFYKRTGTTWSNTQTLTATIPFNDPRAIRASVSDDGEWCVCTAIFNTVTTRLFDVWRRVGDTWSYQASRFFPGNLNRNCAISNGGTRILNGNTVCIRSGNVVNVEQDLPLGTGYTDVLDQDMNSWGDKIVLIATGTGLPRKIMYFTRSGTTWSNAFEVLNNAAISCRINGGGIFTVSLGNNVIVYNTSFEIEKEIYWKSGSSDVLGQYSLCIDNHNKIAFGSRVPSPAITYVFTEL